MSKKDILTYCHIGKVGGKQLQFYLRSHFGYRYRGVAHAAHRYYQKNELNLELKINPHIRYIGGHDVRPSVDFGADEERIRWFSFFREPKERLLSHYYQQISRPNSPKPSLEEWLDTHPNRSYWNIYMISGENNLDKAIEIIDNKYDFVGLTSHYEESLFLFADKFHLKGFQFNDQRNKKPPESPESFNTILREAEKNKSLIESRLENESILYDHICKLYNKQVDDYGRKRLEKDLANYLSNTKLLRKSNLNNLAALSLDYAVWRPLTRLKKHLLDNEFRT